jgi:Skp family chaperone for outer membrane proteins
MESIDRLLQEFPVAAKAKVEEVKRNLERELTKETEKLQEEKKLLEKEKSDIKSFKDEELGEISKQKQKVEEDRKELEEEKKRMSTIIASNRYNKLGHKVVCRAGRKTTYSRIAIINFR